MKDHTFADIPKEYYSELHSVREKQLMLADWLELDCPINIGSIRLVTGFDTAFDADNNLACASAVTVDISTLETVEEHFLYHQPPIPYIPSFLYHREAPGYLSLFKQLEEKPDILMLDGNGIIHPFGLGLASQLGLDLKLPSIGIAKKLLFGEYQPPLKKGGYSEIIHENKIIGAAFQSMEPPAKPIFISQGHLIDLMSAIYITREFTSNQIYTNKLPLPIILADRLANEKLSQKSL